MSLLRLLFRYLARWLGFEISPYLLEADSPTTMRVIADPSRPANVRVVALRSDAGPPIARARIRFHVLAGPAELGPDQSKERVVVGDASGRASVDVVSRTRAQSLVAAELLDGDGAPVVFTIRTEGVTDTLVITSAPSFSAESGVVAARVQAVDHLRQPVEDLALAVEGWFDHGNVVAGTVEGRGHGAYEAHLEIRRAGPLLLTAQDRGTGIASHRQVYVLPADPHEIEVVGDADPRKAPPYDEVTLRTRLVDTYGNALDPARLEGEADGEPLESWTVGDEAWFRIRRSGYREVAVAVTDTASATRLRTTLLFAAFWLGDPGVVRPGSTFRTPLLLAPPADRAIRRATIEVEFDAALTSYQHLHPAPPDDVPVTARAEIKGNRLLIEVESERELSAQDAPGGIPVASIEWVCLAPGQTCFTVSGGMSPSVPGWTVCPQQKIDRRQCICVNIIYRTWVSADRRTGRRMIQQARSVITENLYSCCPVLDAKVEICALQGADWLRIMALWGGSLVPLTRAHIDDLFESGICQKEDCVNLYVLPIGVPGLLGRSHLGPPGLTMIDPNAFATTHNLAAHEFGHVLGLTDSTDSARLMHRTVPVGDWISLLECRTIWDTLASYPCV